MLVFVSFLFGCVGGSGYCLVGCVGLCWCVLVFVSWLVCVGSDFCDRTQLSTCPHPPVSIFVARTVNKL